MLVTKYAVISWATLALSSPAATCTVTPTGLAMVQHYEGYAKRAYKDMGKDRWTIGYGHQDTAHEGLLWSREAASKALRLELQSIATQLCSWTTTKLTNNQVTALASLAYNIGKGQFLRSELWKTVQTGSPDVTRFMQYRRIKGEISTGLVRRRTFEAALFVTPDNVKLDVPVIVAAIEKSHKHE